MRGPRAENAPRAAGAGAAVKPAGTEILGTEILGAEILGAEILGARGGAGYETQGTLANTRPAVNAPIFTLGRPSGCPVRCPLGMEPDPG